MNKPQYKLGYGDYLRFRELVLSYSGLYFPEKKRLDLEIGLLKALQNAPKGISDPDSYYHYLQDEDQSRAAAELRRLVNLLTIGETHFFRDDAQFDALANQILPQLIAQKRTAAAAVGTHPPGKPQLRVWSAGCASGEEAYSIAILLRELIPDISNWQIFILATDINQDSLDKGKEASYTDWSFREKRAKSMQSLYFHKEGKKYRLRDDIRQMVTFARLNLIDDAFPAIHNNTISMDLILCRNVTIYFTEKITAHLVSKFYETLLPNGWLGIGHSEHSFFTYRAFVAQSFPGALMYRKTNQATEWPDNWQSPQALPQNGFLHHPSTNGATPSTTPTVPSSSLVIKPILKSVTAPIKTNDVQPDEVYEQAQKLLDEGKSEQAIRVLLPRLGKLIQKKQAAAHYLLAKAYANQGKWEEAKGYGQLAIDLDTLLAEAYFVLAMVNEFEGDLTTAVTNLKRVIYLEQSHPLAHFNLTMLYFKTGQFPLARHTCSTLINILQKYPPEQVIPDTDGSCASQMLGIHCPGALNGRSNGHSGNGYVHNNTQMRSLVDEYSFEDKGTLGTHITLMKWLS